MQTWTGKRRTQRKVGEQHDVPGQGGWRCPPQLGTIDFYDEIHVFNLSVRHHWAMAKWTQGIIPLPGHRKSEDLTLEPTSGNGDIGDPGALLLVSAGARPHWLPTVPLLPTLPLIVAGMGHGGKIYTTETGKH